MMSGIAFMGKHSFKDFGYTISPDKEIGIAEKQKKLITVPFSNSSYDFSELYGSQTYSSRSLTYPINIVNEGNPSRNALIATRTRLLNWLANSPGKQPLLDDDYPGYYFLAELDQGASFQDDWRTGILTANFTAYPFMIGTRPEGHDIWDEFNFELDVAQQVRFDVNRSLMVNLLNVGTPDVIPEIITSSAMSLRKGAITLEVPAGRNRSDDFTLESGDNLITITGTGTIEFVYYKEML
ncbi:phage tail protein [Terribacillus sp. AE2B 122]|uniref:phage tail protein n=1 Tax=Terribacillus sp. AE2B 122 TaxID=1331902 RepID=UPI0020C6D926|nr:phage tail protein [Terribacillus sp. AE2B 122]